MPEPPTILLVEDEEHLAYILRFNLEAEGYRVLTCTSGQDAIRHLEAEDPPIDLLILDLMLPGMSGYEVCEKVRTAGNSLPILMLSARSLPEDRKRGFDVGTDQYMTKPVELDELMSRVKNLLQRFLGRAASGGVPAAPSRIEINGHVVDLNTFQVQGSRPTQLTALEMKLLRYFVDHAGRVVPKSELLERVWGMPGNVTTRAPDQFIRRLRKLFEDEPSRPRHFLTIREAGYRFVP